MRDLPSKIYSVAAVREMDRIAIEDHGVPGYALMQRAAAAAFADARENFPDAGNWQVICGGGNNAGDGYVVARFAHEAGIKVRVVSLVDTAKLRGDAKTAHDDFVSTGGVVERWAGELDDNADLFIDAMLGSGLQRDLEGVYSEAADALNWHWAPVHAMDVPTGVNADTGEVMGNAVVADLTTTFVGLKTGLFLGDGPDVCGELLFADLDIEPEWVADTPCVYRCVDDLALRMALPPRAREAHKGDFGHVLVVGGGPGMPGAALLCGTAALRSGAGRVTIATHPEHAGSIAAARPELMAVGVHDGYDVAALIERSDVIAFGPGLGQTDWAGKMYESILASGKPSVWDADALNWLAGQPAKAPNRVLTPHPGEAARLLGISSADIQIDRDGALAALFEKFGGTVVLKGAGTRTSDGNDVPYLCAAGNPGMAAPGMGDALTGVVAALLGQGIPPAEAAAVGVEVHARAGDLAAEGGERGMLASDLVDCLPWVVNP